MRVLLVGGNSLLAQTLRPVLAAFAEVLTAGRSGCDVLLDMAWPAESFELPEGIDTVIHLAAHFGGRDYASILAAEEVNVLGTLKLAHVCRRAKVGQFIFISSIFAGLSEKSPFYSSYALSKRHAEECLKLYCRDSGLPLTILRPVQLYGEGDSFRRHQPLLYAMLDSAQRGEEIVIHGRNDALRNFIHVADMAEIISGVVRLHIEGCFDCANLCNVHFSEIAAAAVAAFNSASSVRFDEQRPNIPDNAFVSDENLYNRIGYFPRISLAQGLAREAARRQASV
jgi:nucleoside-diphosphate-sugar epimerase